MKSIILSDHRILVSSVAYAAFFLVLAIGLFTLIPSTHAASETQLCDRTIEEFKTSGRVKCGHILWKLHPADASKLPADPFPYLMKYEQVYLILRDITGYERNERELIIEEKCGPGNSGSQCPNGAMLNNKLMHTVGNAIFVHNSFFSETLPFLASDIRSPYATSLLKEMGRVFTPVQGSTSDGYIWDDAIQESMSEIVGILGTILYSQNNNMREQFYARDWCSKQGKADLCHDFFSTVGQYTSIKGDAALADYMSRKDNFDTLFPVPFSTLKVPSSTLTIPKDTTIIESSNLSTEERSRIFTAMIDVIIRDYTESGALFDMYDGFRKTFRAYNVYPYVIKQPSSWHQDPTVLSRDLKYQKANYFIYLLSAYTQKDLSQYFLKWGYPLSKTTKDIILTNVNEPPNYERLPLLGERILSRSFQNTSYASAPRNLSVADPKQTHSLVLSWDPPVDVNYNRVNIYRAETDRGISELIAKDVKGNNFIDTKLHGDKTYYYDIVGATENGKESFVALRAGKQPSPSLPSEPWEEAFYFYSYGPGRITDTLAEINWSTRKAAGSKVMYATTEGGPFTLIEDNAKKFSGQFYLTNLIQNTRYYYRVIAIDDKGLILEKKGIFTTLPSAAPLQAQPSARVATFLPQEQQAVRVAASSRIPTPNGVFVKETGTSNSVEISWTAPSNKKLLTRIYRSVMPGSRGSSLVDAHNTTVWYDNNVVPFATYTYIIIHVDPANGEESQGVAWTISISPIPTLGPRDVSVKRLKDGSNQITWKIPSYYRSARSVVIYRSAKQNELGERIASGIIKNAFMDTPPSGTWHYTVRIMTHLSVESINTNQYRITSPTVHIAIMK